MAMAPATMKALQILRPGVAEWRDAPAPEPGRGEVLVRVEAVNTCPHWDLHIMAGEPMFPGQKLAYPYTLGQPGHEAVGRVAEIGPGVTGFRVDERVAAWRDQGHHRQGCYAQFAVLDAANIIRVPNPLTVEQVASLELAMCVQVAVDRLIQIEAVRDKTVAVAGLGGAGLVALQMLRAYGAAEVVGIDPLPERRRLALDLGASKTLDPADAAKLPGKPFFSAIDCTGLKSAIESLMARTSDALALFGVNREDVAYGFRHRQLALLGYGAHNRAAADKAMNLIREKRLDLAPLVSRKMPFTEYSAGVELLRSHEAIKIMFLPW